MTRALTYFHSRATGRVTSLPVLVLLPHSRCNCRCVMCDIWKANAQMREITPSDLAPHIDAFRRLGVKSVVLSGGEPLMHSNLWALCEQLQSLRVRITVLSTGLVLGDHARKICEVCDDVIVSLDGSREIHNRIRNIPHAYEKLEEGIRALKAIDPQFRITGRCVLQRENYFDVLNIVNTARDLGLDQISFLAADVSTNAFNRPVAWKQERISEIALDEKQIERFESLVCRLIEIHERDIESGFIAESANKLRRLPAYYSALNGRGSFPANRCNAPWVSAVVESDGAVRPCFFHPAFGNIHETPLDEVLNNEEAVSFRKNLDVLQDPVCRKCVCTLFRRP